MKGLHMLLLGLMLGTSNLAARAQELQPETRTPVTPQKKHSPKLSNPPAILSHTESNSLKFLIGKWLYHGNNESIDETWINSSLDELTCIRIKRITSYSVVPTVYTTIPMHRDQSLPEIEIAKPNNSPVKSVTREKEIYTVLDAGRGATVSIVKLDDSKSGVEERWAGSLAQEGMNSVSLKLLNLTSNSDQNKILTYRKIAADKVICVISDGKTARELRLTKVKELARR